MTEDFQQKLAMATPSVSNLAPQDWERKLETSLATGLSSQEAAARLQKDGPNALLEKKSNPLLKFLGYFWGPIPWMIEVAMVLSAIVGHWADFFIIFVLLLGNAVVGFWEEFQAGNAIAALKAKLALKAKAKRDGAWQAVPAQDLVPGDILRLRLGDIIPADAVVLDGDPLEVDQSALTGESLPVTRKIGESLYSGSILKQGEADAVVTATGENTYLGRTAHLVATADPVSHFQQAVLKIGDYLIVFAVVLVALILGVAMSRGDALLTTLQFALVLTVAAVPVAMPTVLSVTMAVGARLLARKQAIVSRLASIEELAGMDILCSDKTGTLTQNCLTLGEPYCLHSTPDALIAAAALASRAEDEDSLDMAVLAGVKDPAALKEYQVIHYQPFDPVNKRTEAELKDPSGKIFSTSKGAPQVILALAKLEPEAEAAVHQAIEDFAKRGYRSLGVARRDAEGPWEFLGILSLYDPPRPDSKSTLDEAKAMGVRVKMVTGDQVAIAEEIARQLDLGADILDAATLPKDLDHLSPQDSSKIEIADGFAQVFPEHKFAIVKALQQKGHIVGMTGDGVNDAPALKEADCGIAVSNATDAARAAASMVLMTPGLSVIITALQEARKIFQRMNSYAMYRIAETIRVLLFMTLSILAFNFYPVTAIMIVLLALLNDGAILSIAYDKVGFSKKPEAWNMSRVLGIATILGVVGVGETFLLFYLADKIFDLSREVIQTIIYLKLSVGGHMMVFIMRTRGPFFESRPANILLFAVISTQAVATLLSVYGILVPAIGWKWAGLVWAYATVWFFIEDLIKQLLYRTIYKNGS